MKKFTFSNDLPIYLQLMKAIRMKIISSEWTQAMRVPSVRELAVQYGVNPNTVQKALNALENEDLVYTERTSGRFITKDSDVIESVRKATINQMVNDFIEEMSQTGIDRRELAGYILSEEEKI